MHHVSVCVSECLYVCVCVCEDLQNSVITCRLKSKLSAAAIPFASVFLWMQPRNSFHASERGSQVIMTFQESLRISATPCDAILPIGLQLLQAFCNPRAVGADTVASPKLSQTEITSRIWTDDVQSLRYLTCRYHWKPLPLEAVLISRLQMPWKFLPRANLLNIADQI